MLNHPPAQDPRVESETFAPLNLNCIANERYPREIQNSRNIHFLHSPLLNYNSLSKSSYSPPRLKRNDRLEKRMVRLLSFFVRGIVKRVSERNIFQFLSLSLSFRSCRAIYYVLLPFFANRINRAIYFAATYTVAKFAKNSVTCP